MPEKPNATWRFVSFNETEREEVPGRIHHWYCKPGMVKQTNLLFVRAHLHPGQAHKFHFHPKMEEILYVLSGSAEQWVEKEKRIMRPGDSLYLPSGIIHGTYNTSGNLLDFLAVLSPASSGEPITVEVADQAPWSSLRD